MELKLPPIIVSQVDVARVLRELNGLADFFASAAVRKSGTPMQPPKLTRVLTRLAEENHFNLLEDSNRKELVRILNEILERAPLLHVSFAAEPPVRALETILVWLRNNIHPQTLLQVGLQPNVAAGCVLRTPSKVFDLSMRTYLQRQESYLVELIAGAARG